MMRRGFTTLAVLFLVAALTAGGTQASTRGARLSLIKSKSFCATYAYDARLYVLVTIRNSGNRVGKLQMRPWRRYSDGSVNESIVDVFTVSVPAGVTKGFKSIYNYNAEDHALRECGVYIGHSFNVTPLKVVAL